MRDRHRQVGVRQTGEIERQVRERQVRQVRGGSPVCASSQCCCSVVTTQVQVTEVHGHVARDPHVAPGPLGVSVRVTALVPRERDLGDEVLVSAQLHDLGRGPLQTGVAPQGHVQVALVVYAVAFQTLSGSDRFRGHGCRDKVLTFTEKRDSSSQSEL